MAEESNPDSISSNALDLLVGFGGSETMPHDVEPFVNGLAERIATQGMAVTTKTGEHSSQGTPNIWATITDVLLAYPTTVDQNSLVVMYRSEEDGEIQSREVGAHRVERPLGFHFTRCGFRGCPSMNASGHIRGDLFQDRIQITCKACGGRSGRKTIEDIEKKEYFTRLHRTRAPMLFYHGYPAPAGIWDYFFPVKK